MTTKIVDERKQPFGALEAAALVRERAREALPQDWIHVSGSNLAAEIERRAAAAGKEAKEREIKPGEWFYTAAGSLGHYLYEFNGGAQIYWPASKYCNRNFAAPPRGVPVNVTLTITDQEA